jgi:hypothetical protein
MVRILFILPLVFFVLLAGCIDEKPPEQGTIQFTSSPVGAQVYLDSQFRGTTPSTLTGIVPGNHSIEFRYPGYQSWATMMTVSSGSNNVFLALAPDTSSASGTSGVALPVSVPASSPSPVSITLTLDRQQMVIGDSMTFSGMAEGCTNVLLTMYGPGSYTNGILLSKSDVSSIGTWKYNWNPGSKIQSGTYMIQVTDPGNLVSERQQFSVIGGGSVTAVSNSYTAGRGDTLRFSGLCTTGAQTIQLVLYGPDRFSGGVELGTISVTADNNWNFKYTLDNTVPTGIYTLYAYDVPRTTSGTTQFTVGYTGSPT